MVGGWMAGGCMDGGWMSCGWMECGWMDCGWIDCHWMNCGQRIDGHVIDDQSLSGAHTTSDVRRVGDPTSNRQMVVHKLGVDGWEVYASLEGSLAGMGCCSTVGSDLGSTDEHKGVVAEAVEMVVLGGAWPGTHHNRVGQFLYMVDTFLAGRNLWEGREVAVVVVFHTELGTVGVGWQVS